MVLLLTLILTLILGVWWVVVEKGLTMLVERVWSILSERRPIRHPSPERDVFFEHRDPKQRRDGQSRDCPGPAWKLHGGRLPLSGAVLAFSR